MQNRNYGETSAEVVPIISKVKIVELQGIFGGDAVMQGLTKA